MYNTTNKLDVSQIYHKWNLLFRLSSIFYRIRLYFLKRLVRAILFRLINKFQNLYIKYSCLSVQCSFKIYPVLLIICFLDVWKIIFHFTLSTFLLFLMSNITYVLYDMYPSLKHISLS